MSVFEPVVIHCKSGLLIPNQLLYPGYKSLITCGLRFTVSRLEGRKQQREKKKMMSLCWANYFNYYDLVSREGIEPPTY